MAANSRLGSRTLIPSKYRNQSVDANPSSTPATPQPPILTTKGHNTKSPVQGAGARLGQHQGQGATHRAPQTLQAGARPQPQAGAPPAGALTRRGTVQGHARPPSAGSPTLRRLGGTPPQGSRRGGRGACARPPSPPSRCALQPPPLPAEPPSRVPPRRAVPLGPATFRAERAGAEAEVGAFSRFLFKSSSLHRERLLAKS